MIPTFTIKDEETILAEAQVQDEDISKLFENSSHLGSCFQIAKDLVHTITENLQNENCITENTLKGLNSCSEYELEKVFQTLSDVLNENQVLYMGISWQEGSTKTLLISKYCYHLLIPQVMTFLLPCLIVFFKLNSISD